MHIRLIAIGDRQPGWVNEAFDEYVQRLPRQWQFRLQALASGRRGRLKDSASASESEGRRILAELRD